MVNLESYSTDCNSTNKVGLIKLISTAILIDLIRIVNIKSLTFYVFYISSLFSNQSAIIGLNHSANSTLSTDLDPKN